MSARLLAFVVLASCSVDHVIAVSKSFDSTDAGTDAGLDERTIELQWGMYAQQLSLPRCADGGVLLVDSLDDEVEGGDDMTDRAAAGATLSLREAIVLAFNTPGRHTIAFDAAVFPPNAAATIQVSQEKNFPGALLDTCIDARGRGVIVEFQYRDFCSSNCAWSLGRGSLMVGLVLKGAMGKMGLAHAQVAGNRFMVDYQALQASDAAVVGPHNVFGHGSYGVRVDFYAGTTIASIENNFFGIEPTTGANLDLLVGLTIFRRIRAINNVSRSAMQLSGSEGGAFTQNQQLGITSSLIVQGSDWLVSQNTLASAINHPTQTTGNRFIQNIYGGTYTSEAGATAPATDGGVGSLTGTCPAIGQVELYRREGAQWQPLGGTALCRDGQPTWSITSVELVGGTETKTLFTGLVDGNTGPFSPSFAIP